MAHKTRVNGTNYEITGGKTMVGGTAYKVTGGKTLVGGTAYKISFLPAVGTALSSCTPEEIHAIAQSGLASSYWSVGDTVPITLNGTVGALTFSNETYYAFIIGFDHNSSIEGNHTIHFQFGKTSDGTDIAFEKNYSSTGFGDGSGFHMNTSNDNSGGWNGSDMRRTICPAFLSAMPSAWQKVIKACTKYSDNTGGGSDNASYVTATSDKIWLLAEFEVHAQVEYANSNEQNYQKQYAYYANGNEKKKYMHDDTGSSCHWWLRSVRASTNQNFCRVVSDSPNASGAKNSLGFAPGFMVG